MGQLALFYQQPANRELTQLGGCAYDPVALRGIDNLAAGNREAGANPALPRNCNRNDRRMMPRPFRLEGAASRTAEARRPRSPQIAK